MTKRRYYRTAALLGAQPITGVRRPRRALPAIKISWPPVLGGITAVVIWLWLLLDPGWYVSAARVEVLGATEETARAAVLAGQMLGVHTFQVRPEAIADRIREQVPAVTAAGVSCRFYPAGCTVQVVERQPALIWTAEAGPQWVDREGVVFAARVAATGLPTVRGSLPLVEGRVPLEILEGVWALGRLKEPIKDLEYVPGRGLVWSDSQGRRVALGTGTGMAARWRAYQSLVQALDARAIFPLTIDVQFPEAPTYALERAW